MAGFEDGRKRAKSQVMRAAIAAGKDKEMDFLLEPPEEMQSRRNIEFSPLRSISDL